jgi:hypothetical protein
VVGTNANLGVVPMGTANALARNLGLSPDPLRAILQLAGASGAKIPVGQVEYSAGNVGSEPQSRYFAVLAGAGPDGALVYSLLAGKAALGRTAYYAHAARLFMTRRFPPFRISYRLTGSDCWQEDRAVSAMCARVGDLGASSAGSHEEVRFIRRACGSLTCGHQGESHCLHGSSQANWESTGEIRGCKRSKSTSSAANRLVQPPTCMLRWMESGSDGFQSKYGWCRTLFRS